MTRVAIVNLSKFADVGTAPEFPKGIDILSKCGIETTDYASGRAEPGRMVDGLRLAIADPEVGIVLTYSGGNAAIACLDLIDWDGVGKSGKVFAGLSDFTHFSWKAVEAGASCVYGLALKDFVKYRLTEEERRPGIEFLKSGKVAPLAPVLLRGEDVIADWSLEKIVGGHSFISLLMAAESGLDLSGRVLMLEHHYNQAENLHDLWYWGEALGRAFSKNRPKAVLLGRSMVFDPDGSPSGTKETNEALCRGLAALDRPIYFTDHLSYVIPFKA